MVAEVYAHPLRGRVLNALSEYPWATVRAVAERVGEPARRVRHQIDALVDLGLIAVTGEEVGRGVLEPRYGAVPIIVREDTVDPLSQEERMELAKAASLFLMNDIAVAAAAGTMSRRADDFEMRTYAEVDDECLDELVDLHWRAYSDIFSTVQEGRERVWESGMPGTEIISALFLFEAPLWGKVVRSPSRGKPGPRPAVHGDDGPDLPSVIDPAVHPDRQAIAKAFENPVRGRVLTALSERPDVTIREVAERVGEPPRRVRHHVDGLLETGLITVTSSENLSGVIQRRYGAGPLVVDDVDGWSREERVRYANTTVRLLAEDIGVAVAAGTIANGGDDFEVRIYGEVDDVCLERLADLHLRTDRAVRQMIFEGRDRVMRGGETGTEVVTALFLFEAPLWRHVISRR